MGAGKSSKQPTSNATGEGAAEAPECQGIRTRLRPATARVSRASTRCGARAVLPLRAQFA